MAVNTMTITRRRFLTIAAAATATLAVAGPARAAATRWRGRALGGEAEIVLDHPDDATARAALADCVDELARLEDVFSLYRPQSALAQLNAAGRLEAPPPELVRALADAQAIAAASDGAFDPTVQPLWRLHADRLATGQRPSADEIAEARALVDWRAVQVSAARVILGRPGMAVTLNGLAQGIISDRVAELLKRHGFDHALVDLGEIAATGPHGDGSPWQVSVRDPADHARALQRFTLTAGGLATSEAMGSSFAAGGAYGHLLDPASGQPALDVASVTVRAATATLADGLSTALAVAGADRAAAILARMPGMHAVLRTKDGRVVEV